MASFNIDTYTIHTHAPFSNEELYAIYAHIPLNDEELYVRYGTAARLRTAFEDLYKLLLRHPNLNGVLERQTQFCSSLHFKKYFIPEDYFLAYHTESALLRALYNFYSAVSQIFFVNAQNLNKYNVQFALLILKLRYFVEQPETNWQLAMHTGSRILGAIAGFSNIFISDDMKPPNTLYVFLAFLFVLALELFSEIVADAAKHNYGKNIFLQEAWNSLKISFNWYAIAFGSSFMKTIYSCLMVALFIISIKGLHTLYTRHQYFLSGPTEIDDVISIALYILRYKSISQQQFELLNEIYNLVDEQSQSSNHLDQSELREKLKKINASPPVEIQVTRIDLQNLINQFLELRNQDSLRSGLPQADDIL